MSSRNGSVRRAPIMLALRRNGLVLFERLPKRLRKRIVRAVTPNYTLGAVVLLRDTQNRILLLRQPGRDGWSLPGGLLSRGEEPITAAARELVEETGVRLPVEAFEPANPCAFVNPRTQQVDCVFTATAPADVRIHVDNAEIIEARWADPTAPETLPRLTRPTHYLFDVYGILPLPPGF